MKLIWLIVGKDARHFRLPLALWAVLVTVRQATEWWGLSTVTDDVSWKERIQLFSYLFLVMELAVAYVLAAAMMQEDSVQGTNAGWMTRPISGTRMLTAKLLGCALLLVAFPLLVALPWHVGGDRAGAITFLQLSTWHGWVVVPAVVLGAFCRSFGPFFGWSLAFPIIAAMWSMGDPHRYNQPALHLTWAFATVGGVLALALLYTRRTSPRGLFVLIGTVTVALGMLAAIWS